MVWFSIAAKRKEDGRRPAHPGQFLSKQEAGRKWDWKLVRGPARQKEKVLPGLGAPGQAGNSLPGSTLGGVVAFAGENPEVAIGHFDFDFAEFSIARGVCRVVAERILAAQLLGNLIESLHQFLFRADRDHAPAGFLHEFFRSTHVPAVVGISPLRR